MKICTLQVALALTFSGLGLAHDNYGQLLNKKITLTLNEVSLDEALQSIERLTNVKFFYSIDQLGIRGSLSLVAVNRSLREVLEELLSPYNVKFKVHEKRSTITLKRDAGDSQTRNITLMPTNLLAQMTRQRLQPLPAG